MKNVLILLVILLAFGCGDDSAPSGSSNGSANAQANGQANAQANGQANGGTNAATNNGASDAGASNSRPDASQPADAANNTEMDSGSADAGMDANEADAAQDDASMPTPFGNPAAPGAYGVSTATATVTLGGDQVPLTIYLPDAADTYPTVIFHHGMSLSPSLYVSYGERLASWGYVAILPEMPGGIFGGPSHSDLKDNVIELMDWVEANGADAGSALAGKAGNTFVLAGHSLGGKISFLTATQDARVDAVFAIDPVDSAGGPGSQPSPENPSVTPELMGAVAAPMAIVGETVNATCTGFFCQACAPEDENFEQYYMAATSPAYVLDVLGADHMSFLDNSNCGACLLCDDGSDNPVTTRAITQTTMIAFLELKVRGIEAARAYLTGANAPQAALAVHQTKNGF